MHPNDQALAQLAGVHKTYGKTQALQGVDLAVHAGQLLALLGPNGAGKSTAINLLLGMEQPDAGRASLFGCAPQQLQARSRVGVMLQSAGLPDTLRVDELLHLTRSYYADPYTAAECIELAGLGGLMQRRYGRLSGGQQRRVQFALAICGRPRLLFLDEPSTGLDIEARQGVWQAIRTLQADGCAVLLTTHYLEEADALADRVAVLQDGRIVAEGGIAQIRAQVAQRRIRCSSSLDALEVGQWQHVRSARLDAGTLEIVADAAEPVVLQLLTRDPHLGALEVRAANLADAFLHITSAHGAKEAA